MLYKKREYFKSISEFLGRIFTKICPYPNLWTIFGIMTAIVTFYFLYEQNFLIAATFFAITAIIDVIDGAVARRTNRATNFGAYLDTVVDRVTEFIILCGLFFVDYPDFIFSTKAWIFLVLFGFLMTTYVKAAASEKKIVKKEIKGGILERGERMILLFLIILFSNFSLEYSAIMLAITAIFSIFTVLQRFFIALNQWAIV